MPIFKNDDDAIRFELRKLWHDIMRREFLNGEELNRMVDVWKAEGAEAAIRTIMDSPEGSMRQWQMQVLLDKQGRPHQQTEVFPPGHV